MGNKFSKYLGYTFLACIVLYFVLNSADVTVNPWVPTVKLVCFIIGILFRNKKNRIKQKEIQWIIYGLCK